MSLNVWIKKEDVPVNVGLVTLNDLYFNVNTLLTNTPLVEEVLRSVDHAERVSDLTFLGRTPELGCLNKMYLSTGGKTLLNVLEHPDKCFDLIECGQNALCFLPKITEGNVLLAYPIIYAGTSECDIVCYGREFSDFYEFLDFLDEKMGEV